MDRLRPVTLGFAALILCAGSPVGAHAERQTPVRVKRSMLDSVLLARMAGARLNVVGPTRSDTVAASAEEIRLASNQYVAAVVGREARLDSTRGERHLVLPIRFAQLNERGDVELLLWPRIDPGAGLEYAPDDQAFRGAFLVGLEDSLHPTRRTPLPTRVFLQLTSAAGQVSPVTVEITHSNIPYVPVEISSRRPADTVEIRIRAEFDTTSVVAKLPVNRPRVRVTTAAPAIQGFGLEALTVTVEVAPAAVGTARTVMLSGGGSIEPNPVPLGPDGTGSATLRSRGVGAVTLTATSDPFLPGEAPVRFTWPLAFLGASLLGGLAGAVAARTRAKRQKTPTSLARLGADGVSGVITGLIVSAAYAVGINLTGFDIRVPFGEAAAFVCAALGAVYGLPGLGKAVPTVGRRLSGGGPGPD